MPQRQALRLNLGLGAVANWGLAGLVAALVLLPLIALAYSSLKVSASKLPFEVPGFSLGNFRDILTGPALGKVGADTAVLVGGTLVIGLTLSLGLTYLLERTDVPGRQLFSTLIVSPMAVPAVVMAIAWAFLANPTNGPLSLALKRVFGTTISIYSLGGMTVVTGLLVVPSLYLLIAPQFARFDSSLEEAATMAGAGWWQRTRLVALPLLRPVLLAAAMLLIVVSLETFDVPAILGFPRNVYVFSTLIQQSIQPPNGVPNYGQASGYGMLLLLIAGLLALLYRHAVRGSHRFQTITGKGYRPAVVRLGHWRGLAGALVLLYFLGAVCAPLLLLLWASLLPYYSVPDLSMLGRLSLANFIALPGVPGVREATLNTVAIVLASATATTALAFMAAWASVRARFRGSWLLVEGSFLTLGVPGVVLGVSLMYLYLRLPVPVFGTIWIIVIAYVTRFLAYNVRLMDASFRQLARDLEEAGQMTGASPFAVLCRIVLPLMLPAVLRGWLWVAVHALKELPMALILSTSASQTLTVTLWQLWTTNADYSTASALAIVLTLVSGAAIWMVNRHAQSGEEAAAARV